MAPTVYVSEISERPFSLEDHLLNLSTIHCIGDRRRRSQTKKRSLRHTQLHCHKLNMGLVVEECHQSPPRTDSPSFDCEQSRSNEAYEHHFQSRSQRDSLVHITLRTLALLRRNQQLQHKLSLLQAETRAFVESVLNSPENISSDQGVVQSKN